MEKLTVETIEAIETALHERIQFYDSEGKQANDKVIEEIKAVLAEIEIE